MELPQQLRDHLKRIWDVKKIIIIRVEYQGTHIKLPSGHNGSSLSFPLGKLFRKYGFQSLKSKDSQSLLRFRCLIKKKRKKSSSSVLRSRQAWETLPR